MNLGALTRKLNKIETRYRERKVATELHALFTLAVLGVPVPAATPFTRGQVTVLSWPRRLSLEEWDSSTTHASQHKLMADTRDAFEPGEAPVRGRDPAEVTHTFTRNTPPPPLDTRPLEEKVRTADENYRLALLRQCSAMRLR